MTEPRPYLITGKDAEGEELPGLPSEEKAFHEDWLQETLFKHPSILPVELVDEAFGPLVSIGREIASTDNLFISPRGLLTIAETKLWRNPEAHRTVVAQILEYAGNLATWHYQDLDEAVRNFMRKRHGTPTPLYELVRDLSERLGFGEMEFKQMVEDSLETGRFALLVVGDHIYPSAMQLAEVIQPATRLEFSIRFVELQCYRLKKGSDWPLVVFPRLVAKTREETRAVVKVIFKKEKPEVEVAAPAETESGHTSYAEFTASIPPNVVEVFQPYIDKWMKEGHTFYWGVKGFSLRIRWGAKRRLITVFDAYPEFAGVLTEKWELAYELPKDLYSKYRKSLMESTPIRTLISSGKRYIAYEMMSDSDLRLLLDATDTLLHSLCVPPASPEPRSVAEGGVGAGGRAAE
jgi:hypothetical protein